MKMALKTGGLNLEDISYINAHGTSTPQGDVCETQAIKTVFGEHAKKIAVSSTKGATGHMLGAAGAVEMTVCALAIKNGIVPPTINYQTPDPECDLDYVPNTAREMKVNAIINNSFGFGGHNATIAAKFASRLDRRNFRQVRRQFVRLESFHLQRNQTFKRHAKIHRAVGTIHHHRHADDLPPCARTMSKVSCTRPPLVTTSSTTRIFSPAAILKPRRKTSLPSSFSTKINRKPSCRATSWPMTSPPIAGETTVTAPSGFNFAASAAPSFSTTGICWSASAHWKNCRLCKPLRKTKWPSSNAPNRGKSATLHLLSWRGF
jgi:hypothetical protein